MFKNFFKNFKNFTGRLDKVLFSENDALISNRKGEASNMTQQAKTVNSNKPCGNRGNEVKDVLVENMESNDMA